MNPPQIVKHQTKQAIGELRRGYKRWRGPSPFAGDGPSPLIVHACYHRVGSGWFMGLLREVARPYGMRVDLTHEGTSGRRSDTVVDWRSRIDP
ncbi:MAG: hypothetical protein AAGJ46_01520 [Planctomycetota bacterium]